MKLQKTEFETELHTNKEHVIAEIYKMFIKIRYRSKRIYDKIS